MRAAEPGGLPGQTIGPVSKPDPLSKLYHFWARTYSPELGRFLQEDEQGPLAPVVVSLSGDGDSPSVSPPQIDAGSEYADALNLFLYVGANPTNLRDPFGLSNDEYDDLMDDLTGHKVAALGYIQDSAAAVGLGIRTSLNIAGSLLGVDVFQSVVILASGGGGFWEAMDIVLSLNPAGRVFKLAGKAAVWARRFARAGKMLDAFRDAGKYGIKSYKLLAKEIAHKGLEAHHLIEKRFAKLFGCKEADMLSMALTPSEHQVFTNLWRKEIAYGLEGTGAATRAMVEDAARRIYRDYPDILRALGL